MRIIILLIVMIITGSCNDDENAGANVCTFSGPIEEIPWVAALKNSITNCECQISIIRGTYDNQTVIYVWMNDPRCNWTPTTTFYTCEGKKIRTFTTSEVDQLELLYQLRDNNIKADSVLYSCNNWG